MTDYENLLERHKLALLKSLKYLKQSYSKIQSLPSHIKEGDSETLEVWESYVARFARVLEDIKQLTPIVLSIEKIL